MARIEENLCCCGIKELDGITGNKPETILKDICFDWFDDTPRAFIIFSCVRGQVSGHNLAHYIKVKRLGKVYKMAAKYNPNSTNVIHVWMWAVNNPKLKALAIKKDWMKRTDSSHPWW